MQQRQANLQQSPNKWNNIGSTINQLLETIPVHCVINEEQRALCAESPALAAHCRSG